ncbi:MAG: hypothetical protein QOH25_3787 [Acidobacteriota bacterium]|jgi:hypothetical protein|nr:hypothetical protein [Acidobacteriota bacterium]
MKTLSAPLKIHSRLIGFASTFLLLLVLMTSARAQSTEIEYPKPVRASEISGTIAPRDLGDARLTRYFYSFTGTPGDLIVTVESGNLEGDVDVFTAGVLRPLAKISLYAGGGKSSGSKTIYLRNRESLILRVEARTPNDNEGSFRVRFEGAFEPIGGDVPDPGPVIPTVSSANTPKGRRVTATGARIEEPEPEPTATTQPETTEPATPVTESPADTVETRTTAKATKPPKPKPTTTRTSRPRTPRTTRTRPAPTARRRRTPVETPPAAEPAPVVEAASGPRLIIETRDGMKVERYMTTVRRVTVERGQMVIVTTDGKVERQPMSNVLRMAIEP